MSRKPPETEPLLTPWEVAKLFRVDAKTVTRWAARGKLPFVRTPGGHRRYPESAVLALRNGQSEPSEQSGPGEPGDAPQQTELWAPPQ
ncbi:BldC family transcriptional regulator [Actinomadura terrae]|uniref:BldC family transcriptional regulator n=1 Tax=Actinomadura terrae TaxID=604353 RepID=UPI001FA6CC19|nr:BldC family transcriptional regulator [Actinomadura terrae]